MNFLERPSVQTVKKVTFAFVYCFCLVCSAFNHWQPFGARRSEVDEERLPNYILAVYSSRGVLIDPLPMPDFCLADTLLLLATTKGKRHEVNSIL